MSALGRVLPMRSTGGDGQPGLSFVIPVYEPPTEILRATLASIDAQTCDDWECVVVDDASRVPEVGDLLDHWASADPRHRLVRRPTNGGIAAATNDGIDQATGQIVAFVDHDDLVDPGAAAAIVDHFGRHREHDVVYTDERVIDEGGNVLADYFKPDYSPIRHLGQHYLAHLVAVRADAIGDLRVRPEYEPAQDVDFLLRVIERSGAAADRCGHGVGHIARQLYSWRAIQGSSALAADEKQGMSDAVRRSIDAALVRRGIEAATTTVLHDDTETTSVLLAPVARAASVAVIPIDHESTGRDLRAALSGSDEEVVVFEPPGAPPGWWREIVGVLDLPGVAVVGPMLVDDGGLIMSAGRTIDPVLRDILAGTPSGPGPWGAHFVHREVSAVAPWGAVVKREGVESVGGIDATLGTDAAIADLCARLRKAGQSIICSPAASLVVDPALGASHARRDDDWAMLVASRSDDDWAERFDPTGIAPRGARRRSAWAEARARIVTGAIDLVTTDVFDTVVTRPVSRPSDLFVLIGRRLADQHVTDHTPVVFAEARRHAEAAARRVVRRRDRVDRIDRAPEVTLTDIWARLGPIVGVDPAVGVATELDIEAAHLAPIPELRDVLVTARQRGCRIVAVSDTYFSATQLSNLLSRSGLANDLFDRVVTSADAGICKADGLLERVIADAGIDTTRVLHLGDNEIADVQAAERLGAEVAHVEVPSGLRHVARPRPALATWSAHTGSDGGIDAAIRSTLVSAGSLGTDPGYQFGVAAAGPALVGFARWAATTAAELGVSNLHCLLREGAEISRLADIVVPDAVAMRLVHASRWVTMRAACIEATPDQLFSALARRGPTSAEFVEAAFGCPARDVASVWGTEAVTPDQLDVACARLASDDRLREQIVDAAADLRRRVAALIEREVADDDRIVLCDVGWGGRIQEGLTRILRSIGDERPVTGLYFALSEVGEDRLAAGADMWSYLPSIADDRAASVNSRVVSHHADSIERVLTPQIGTLVDVDDDGSPVTAARVEYQAPSLIAARSGIEHLAQRIAATELDDGFLEDPATRIALASDLADVIEYPSAGVARALLDWQHDDVGGADVHSLSGFTDPELAAAMTIDNADLFRTQTGTWVEGLAAVHHPSFAAQLIAARRHGSGANLVGRDGLGPALLAAFPIDSEQAELQVRRDPGLGASGQLALRLAGPVSSLRTLRFDAAEGDTLLHLERLGLTVTADDGTRIVVDVREQISGPGIRHMGTDRFGQRAGGHVAYSLDEVTARRIRHLDAVVVFRRWPLSDDDPAVRSAPFADTITRLGRRTRAAIRSAIDSGA